MSLLIRGLTCIILLFFGSIGYSHADNLNQTQSCEIATRQVALDNGVLYYNQAGQGAPVLLLHGLFAQKEQWNAVLCLIAAAGYIAIAPDLPVYGKSIDFPIADYTLDDQVERLRQFMDAWESPRSISLAVPWAARLPHAMLSAIPARFALSLLSAHH